MKKTVILFGCPGAGKDLQKEKLEAAVTQSGYQCKTLDVGGHFRNLMKERKTEVVELFSGKMDQGILLPVAFPIAALTEAVVFSEWDFFIATGIGRRIEELKIAVNLLHEIPKNKINAILINISEEEAEQRLLLRDRTDDQKDIIRKRRIESCLYIKKSWRHLQENCPSVSVFKVSGHGTPEEVHKRVADRLNLSQVADPVPFPYQSN